MLLIEKRIQQQTIVDVLSRAYEELRTAQQGSTEHTVAHAHLNGIVTGLLMQFSMPEIEGFMRQAGA